MPKAKENDEDIQDSCNWNEDGTLAAIADGTATSYFSKEWADLLVKHFCSDESSIERIVSDNRGWLKAPQEEWRSFSLNIQQDNSAAWNIKATINRDCGDATFLGVKFCLPEADSIEGKWRAVAVGDSCLFQITTNHKISAIPIKKSQDFKSTSQVIRSLPEKASASFTLFPYETYTKGDTFLLATDELAKWILRDWEDGNNQWKKLLTISDKDDFRLFVEHLRSKKLIANDDTTLCIIKIDFASIETAQQPNSLPTSVEHPTSPVVAVTETINDSSLPTNPQNLQVSNPPISSPLVGDSKLVGGGKDKYKRTEEFDIKFGFRILAVIGVIGWILSIFNILISNDKHSNQPPVTQPPVMKSEGVPVYRADGSGNKVGVLFQIPNISENEIDLLVISPNGYLNPVNDQTSIIKNQQILPIFQSDSCLDKDNIGYLLPNANLQILIRDIKNIPNIPNVPNVYRDGKIIKIKLRIQRYQ
jgi:hypothetical protein